MKVLGVAALIAAGALGVSDAGAATLGLATEPPSVTALGRVDASVGNGSVQIATFAAGVTSVDGMPVTDFIGIWFLADVPRPDPTSGFSGDFDLDDGADFRLSGQLSAVGFAEDLIEFQFDDLTGPLATTFGSSVLMRIAFDDPFDELGTNPFADLQSGSCLFPVSNCYDTTITLAKVAPVPLPAGLPLLVTGLMGFGLLAGRRADRT